MISLKETFVGIGLAVAVVGGYYSYPYIDMYMTVTSDIKTIAKEASEAAVDDRRYIEASDLTVVDDEAENRKITTIKINGEDQKYGVMKVSKIKDALDVVNHEKIYVYNKPIHSDFLSRIDSEKHLGPTQITALCFENDSDTFCTGMIFMP